MSNNEKELLAQAYAYILSDAWGKPRQANRLIAASETIQNLEPMGSILPATESQARPLTSLEPVLSG